MQGLDFTGLMANGNKEGWENYKIEILNTWKLLLRKATVVSEIQSVTKF